MSRGRRRRSANRATRRRRNRTPTSQVRLSRWLAVIATVLILSVAGGTYVADILGRGTGTPTPAAVPAEVQYTPVPGATLAEVERIVDGDTLVVRSGSDQMTVRLYGVDTPERGEACFHEATDRLGELAATHVQLLPGPRLTDRFGRDLRYVYSLDGVLIDELLVAEGLGVAWRDDGQYRDRIIEIEDVARAERQGCLWGS